MQGSRIRGDSRGAITPAPQDLADQLPYLNQGEQIMPTTFLLTTPDFQTFLRSWYVVQSVQAKAHTHYLELIL